MKQQSFRINIFVMFMVLGLVAGMLFYHYMHTRYQEVTEASTRVYAAEYGEKLSALIHAVQQERSIHAGYLSGGAYAPASALLKTGQHQTDTALKAFQELLHADTAARHRLTQRMKTYSQPRRQRMMKAMDRIGVIRERIESYQIGFEEMAEYYRALIQEMIDLYYGLLWSTQSRYAYLMDVYQIERIKELAERESMYVHKVLLSHHYFLRDVARIRSWVDKQKSALKTFRANLTPEARAHFARTVHPETEQAVRAYRERFFRYALTAQDAPDWYRVSQKRVKEFGQLSMQTAEEYLVRMQGIEQRARRTLYGISFLGFVGVVTFGVLLILLRRLLGYVGETLNDLRIASYAFDSYEAMVIMDPDGVILRVNRAFSDITGYGADEVTGQSPAMLYANVSGDRFYQRMWEELTRDGYWQGEIRNRRKNGEIYDERLSITAIKDPYDQTQYYISHFLDISDLKKAEAKARHQATHDFLTGLPNRKLMNTFLRDEDTRARHRDVYDAFLFIDLDDFKKINDVYGHNAGDRVLIEVARRLMEQVGGNDFVARISGDEFCVILTDIGRNDQEAYHQTQQICRKILSALDQPYRLEEQHLNMGVSIGIKLFPDREHNQQIEEIISNADAAMYRAKEEGKNRFVFYDHDVKWRVRELAIMEKGLKKALDEDELVFYFQPKIDVRSEEVVGAELLVRWEHPERGVLPSPVFLEALHNLSMMPRLNEMAIETACRFLRDNDGLFRGTLAINISVREICSERFYQTVKGVTEHYGVDPARIEIEILENDLIDDFDTVVHNMERLRSLGIQFAIDDFGVGYSSISYLNTLPVDTLKIDRNFIARLHDKQTRDLVRVMISLARIFGLKSVLEGVEEHYQLEFARSSGADIYQGYLFSQAVDETTFVSILAEQSYSQTA